MSDLPVAEVDPDELRRRADALRDARDWAGAAVAYATYLEHAPEDWPIWIQRGHAVKEAGDPAAALACYRQAETGLPRDSDLQLQIGHALKLLGRLAEAEQAYTRAVEFDPASENAWRELSTLRRRQREASPPAEAGTPKPPSATAAEPSPRREPQPAPAAAPPASVVTVQVPPHLTATAPPAAPTAQRAAAAPAPRAVPEAGPASPPPAPRTVSLQPPPSVMVPQPPAEGTVAQNPPPQIAAVSEAPASATAPAPESPRSGGPGAEPWPASPPAPRPALRPALRPLPAVANVPWPSARQAEPAATPPPPEGTEAAPDAMPPVAAPRASANPVRTVLLDLTDLFAWFDAQRAPSGIQRVQLELATEALRPAEAGPAVRLVVFRPEIGAWREVPGDAFQPLYALSRTGAETDDPAWRQALEAAQEALREGPDVEFPEEDGTWLVSPGTSWWLPDYFRHLRELKARTGVGFAPLLHDCVPLVVPEHCQTELVAQYARWFASLSQHADLLLVTSRSTRDDLERLQAELLPGLPLPPVAQIPLDAAPTAPPTQGAGQAKAPALPRGLGLDGRPFVLCVSTIESRKDHLLLFNAWLSLARRRGTASLPRLVCVGRPGWLADAAMGLYRNSPVLQDRVVLLHDVSDATLGALYERCLFTVYNSHHEGWGLPVTESLAHRKVPLVAAIPALLEAGGAGAVAFRPRSEPDLVEKLERLIFDAEFRSAQEARIASEVRLRGWDAVVAGLLDELGAAPPPMREVPRPPIVLGQDYPLVRLPGGVPNPAMAVADMLRLGHHWHAPEDWGTWTRPGPARLGLSLVPDEKASSDTPLRVHLDLVAPPGPFPQQVTIRLPGRAEALVLELEPDQVTTCVLETRFGTGALEIELDAAHPVEGPVAEGSVGVGVASLMVCRSDDLLSRLEYLERRRYLWPQPA